MPFKLQLIKEFQKIIKSLRNAATPQLEENKSNEKATKSRPKATKKLVNKNYNIFQIIWIREPTSEHHVFNFYNIIGLNQKAIASSEFEESKFTTIFYIKNVKKVELKPNVVTLELCNSNLAFPPIEYIIERYKSFGDMKFYNLANLLQEAAKRVKLIEQIVVNQAIQGNSEQFDRYIQSMGNKMYICRSTSNKLVISKTLLDLLEYDVQQFALELVKYKAPLNEIFTADKYFEVVTKMVQNLRNLFDLINDRISLQSFLSSSIIRFRDYIITKSHKKIYCRLKVGMPNPILNLMEVEEVISCPEDQFHQVESDLRISIEEMKKKKQTTQICTIRKIISLPKNLLPENSGKVAEFLPLPNCQTVG